MWALLFVMGGATSPPVQDAAGLIAAQTRPLEGSAREPSGPAWEFLVEECSAATFVAFGEQHGLADVPRFATALFTHLNEHDGFRYLAVENDPWTMQALGRDPLRGDVDAIASWLERFPMAAAFAFLEEVELYAEAGLLSTAEDSPLWGLDQVTGAAAHLDAIARSLPAGQGRDEVRSLAEEVAAVERRRFEADNGPGSIEPAFWILKDGAAASLDEVERVLAGAPVPGAPERLAALRESQRIYRHSFEGRPYANNAEREALLKREFLRHWQRARERDGGTPRVLVKLGAAHLSRLDNVARVPSLGSYLAAFAEQLGGLSFHLAVFGGGGRLSIAALSPSASRILDSLPRGQDCVVDLRPLREPALAGELGALDPWLSRLIFGFDAVLVFAEPAPITTRWW